LMQRAFRVLSDGYVANTYRGSSRLLDRAFAAAVALLPTRRAEIDARYRYLPNDPAKVLDYGCGDGTFLKVAQGLGHQVVGVDFDQEALASARGKCIDVLLPNELDQQNPYSLYDHLTLSHVIEHLDDPLGLLRKCRNWLKPTGTLYIEVPNSNARGLGNFGGFWRGLEVPRHFSVPSSNGLKRALEAAGFDVIFLGTRAFAHVYMDAASEAARNKFDCNVGLDPPQQTITQIKLDSATTSAEMLTCLARPCKAVEI
ncbi:MAG: class I SAM-dependent methyltransferase, partial [Lentilitoribacter sp.]